MNRVILSFGYRRLCGMNGTDWRLYVDGKLQAEGWTSGGRDAAEVDAWQAIRDYEAKQRTQKMVDAQQRTAIDVESMETRIACLSGSHPFKKLDND